MVDGLYPNKEPRVPKKCQNKKVCAPKLAIINECMTKANKLKEFTSAAAGDMEMLCFGTTRTIVGIL